MSKGDRPRRGKRLALSLAALAAGLGLGALLLFMGGGRDAARRFVSALPKSFYQAEALGYTLYRAAALTFTALAAAAAFRGGMMNLGGPGQYLMGAACALYGAAQWNLNWWQAMILAAVGGGAWGALPGILRAKRGISEGITSSIMNWLGLYLARFFAVRFPALEGAGARAAVPGVGLFRLLGMPYDDGGLLIALCFALILWAFFRWSAAGYEITALGLSRRAARYAGIDTKKATVRLMALSGGLAGLGGGVYYLSGAVRLTMDAQPPFLGFLGVAAALLGGNHPLALLPWVLILSGTQTAAAFAQLDVDFVSALASGAVLVCAFAPRLTRENVGGGE